MRFRRTPRTRNFRGGRFGPPCGERLHGGFVAGDALRCSCGNRDEYGARVPVRPVALQDEFVDARACGREVNLRDGDGALTQSIADDEEIVTARFIESDRPAFPQTVRRETLRVGTDVTKSTLDDFSADERPMEMMFPLRSRCELGKRGAFDGRSVRRACRAR